MYASCAPSLSDPVEPLPSVKVRLEIRTSNFSNIQLWSKRPFLNADESLRKCRLFLNRQSQRLFTDSHQQRHDIPSEEVRMEEGDRVEERLSEIEQERNIV